MTSPSSIPSMVVDHACLAYADVRPCSFFASENDMNLLVRGVRFSMRVGRADCAKNVFEPKADSSDTKDFFYMGDADPDRVRATSSLSHSPHIADTDLPTYHHLML
jgi:choline dehydrogenase